MFLLFTGVRIKTGVMFKSTGDAVEKIDAAKPGGDPEPVLIIADDIGDKVAVERTRV